MTLEDLGNIGELIAAIATVATLGYLALQIRQNTKVVRGSTAEAVMQSEIASAALIAQHANVYRRGNANISELNADERVVYDEIIFTEISQIWSAFTQYQSGLIDEVGFGGFRAECENYMAKPGFRSVWAKAKEEYPEDFRQFIDKTSAAK